MLHLETSSLPPGRARSAAADVALHRAVLAEEHGVERELRLGDMNPGPPPPDGPCTEFSLDRVSSTGDEWSLSSSRVLFLGERAVEGTQACLMVRPQGNPPEWVCGDACSPVVAWSPASAETATARDPRVHPE